MRCPGLPLCGLLWLGLPLLYGRPVKIDKVKADAKNLTRTLIARIQELQLLPVNLKVSGLDFLPGERPPESLEAMDATLQVFQRVLAGLPLDAVPGAQLANDMENLRSLLRLLGAHLGCAPPAAPAAPALGNLTDLLAEAPYSAAAVALDRLHKSLHGITKHLDQLRCC
ncbi:leptin [Alligator mississippiensis]|uniref:Leptin n=1 Tax=Alligator mississippiensis TaxID=8496 RepID=A0A151MPN9_ALLMI|nr:leptin [Alligator mississippiensis]